MDQPKQKITDFDAADYLDNEKVIAEYLKAAREGPDPAVLAAALADIARARAAKSG